jgi:hypothetical protein
MLLAVAIFAMGMLFASSYNPGPSANNQGQQTEPAAQNGHGSKAATVDDAKGGNAQKQQESGGEFWSAKLTDWLLAAFTALLVAFTYRLWKSTDNLWSASREEFVATHRPRVILRYIQGPFYNDEGHHFIWLTFVNTGANDATIEAFGGDLAYRSGFNEAWEILGLDAELKDIEPITIVCGQRHVFAVTAQTSSSSDEAISKSAWPGRQICAVGRLRYRDANGISRDTGFFRVLDDEGVNFVVSKHDSEMEYQD